MPAPLIAFPIVTQSRFQPRPPSVIVGGCSASRAIDSKAMLATECSKPLATKAYTHQKIARDLAATLVIRADVQIARQTSQLHSIARARSSIAGAFILAAAILRISGLLPARARPPPPATKIDERKTQPTRFPVQDTPQHAARSRKLVRLCSHPKVMNIVCPVNRSEPANMTSVKAIPNEAPITTGRMLGSTFEPTQKIRIIPSPT